MDKTVLVAGATGNLGGKIVDALIKNKAKIKAIVRENSDTEKVNALKQKGVEVIVIDMANTNSLTEACNGVYCVVSALSGLHEVILDAQLQLLNSAIAAKVPKFIPSDFCIDFTNLIPGKNRNLDLRREFHRFLENVPINVTSVFNGAFMDLLTGDMPLIMFKLKRILYWGNRDVKMDLTTTFNAAEFTAYLALDENSPRFLHIAGDRVSAVDVKNIMTELTNKKYKFLHAGSIAVLNTIIGIAKFFNGKSKELYPAWQGMQYMRDMMEGRAVITKHNNNRYPKIKWTSVKDFLQSEKVVNTR